MFAAFYPSHSAFLQLSKSANDSKIFKNDIELISYDSYYNCLNELNEEEKLNYNYDHPNSLDSDLFDKSHSDNKS